MMKKSCLALSSVLALLVWAPVAGSDEGWVDVAVKIQARSALNAGQIQEAESYATAFALFTVNARAKFGQVPDVDMRREGGDYRFYFNSPNEGRRYVRWVDLMSSRWVTYAPR